MDSVQDEINRFMNSFEFERFRVPVLLSRGDCKASASLIPATSLSLATTKSKDCHRRRQ
jgi:hypothetical protein